MTDAMWFILRRKDILAPATRRMHLEGIMLSEINQTQKDKPCMNPLTEVDFPVEIRFTEIES